MCSGFSLPDVSTMECGCLPSPYSQGLDLQKLRGEESGRAGLGIQRTRGSVCAVSRKGQGSPLTGQGAERLCANLTGPDLKDKVLVVSGLVMSPG